MRPTRLRLYCFSPPVMIATFAVEIGLAAYTLVKYRSLPLVKLIIPTLLCLGIFQLSEWMVCQGAMGLSSIDWARVGFVAISFLPPLGIHIATVLAGRHAPRVVSMGYAMAGTFSAYFLFATSGISGSVCGGNYVIFQLAPQAVRLFTSYYYLMLVIGIGLSLYYARKSADINQVSALKGLAAGYASFMLPTVTIILLDRSTTSGIPSIMCGFAITLAIVLVYWVLPKYEMSLRSRAKLTNPNQLRTT